jgi:hypothetical protein
MGPGATGGSVAVFRLGGPFRLRSAHASTNFDTEGAENHGIPRRKASVALRAKGGVTWGRRT